MSHQSDFAGAFDNVETTVPVLYNGVPARGQLDRAGTVREIVRGFPEIVERDTLHLVRAALPTLVPETDITIGELGDASAVGGTACNIAQVRPENDGLGLAVVLTGGDW